MSPILEKLTRYFEEYEFGVYKEAEDDKDGAVWIDLAPLSDESLVPQAVASALGITEQPGRPVREALA